LLLSSRGGIILLGRKINGAVDGAKEFKRSLLSYTMVDYMRCMGSHAKAIRATLVSPSVRAKKRGVPKGIMGSARRRI